MPTSTSALVKANPSEVLKTALQSAAKLALEDDRNLILTHNDVHYFVSPDEIAQFLMRRVMQPAYPNQDRKETT